jgi:hypothetical protein
MLHLLDGFLALLLGKTRKPPVIEQAMMQPVLVDRRHLMAQRLVQIFNDLLVALHIRLLECRVFTLESI